MSSVTSKDLDPDDYRADGKAKNLEGFLWPATYELKPGSDAQDLVDQQLQKRGGHVAVIQDARRTRPRTRAKTVAVGG